MSNPKAGHTSATGMGTSAEGLRDGDGLSSPSLTAPIEAAHGNGILRLEDTTVGASSRNSIATSTPGYIVTAASGVVTVHGGWCVIDGVLYKFAGGPGSTQQITIGATGTANFNGDLPAVPSANSDVYVVVYISSDSTTTARIRYEMGSPAAPSTGTPLIPSTFLSDPLLGLTRNNHQHIVLGVLRYTMTAGAGSVTASLSATPVLHDRRVYVRTSPMYLQHVSKGGSTVGTNIVTSANAVDSHTDLAALYASPESGDLTASFFGALWQSHTPDSHGMLYYAAPHTMGGSIATYTHRLGPSEVKVATISTTQTCTFDGPNMWIATTSGTTTFTPSGTFPPGHVIEIYHTAGAHALNFINAPAGSSTLLNVAADQYAKFVFDGTNWHILDHHAVI
tara:strand:+ start:17525 stop:18706 length:1182 start_codon:yes stop_codon:yes gene_type:complete